MITKIDHVAIAVDRLERRLPFWADVLGLDVSEIETIESEGVKVAFLRIGSAQVELLEPTGPDSTVARFLERRGEGLHHLTLEVSELDPLLDRAREHGVKVL